MVHRILVTAAVLALASAVYADQGRTEIGPTDTFPIVIDTSGSYVLTTDLHVTSTSNAIEIAADYVTLDLGGHVVRGTESPTGSGFGITSSSQKSIVITNGTIVGFWTGISLQGGTEPGGHRLRDLTVRGCDWQGIEFNGGTASDLVVHNNGLVGAVAGIDCTDCTLSNVVATESPFGIQIDRGSAENCTASGNSGFGFLLDYATATGGSSYNNGTGLLLQHGSGAIGVSVSGNSGVGIELSSGGGNNVVNCTGYNNTGGNITGCGDGNGCHQNHLP